MGRLFAHRFVFLLMISYMCVACIISCALLWNITIGYKPTSEISGYNFIPPCAIDERRDDLFNCTLAESLVSDKFVANGWTKTVHRATLDGKSVAIKSVNWTGKDVTDCSQKHSLLSCHNSAVDKIVKEISWMKELKDDTILQLKHYCTRTGEGHCAKQAIIITEMGDPVTNLKLLLLKWSERAKIINDLAKLLHFAQYGHPSGPLRLSDLRRPQFVIINGQLKLADLDDIVLGEPACTSNKDCTSLNFTINCTALTGRCEGFNAKFNIEKSFREFGQYVFIAEGVPEGKRSALDELRQMWEENKVGTKRLLSASQELLS